MEPTIRTTRLAWTSGFLRGKLRPAARAPNRTARSPHARPAATVETRSLSAFPWARGPVAAAERAPLQKADRREPEVAQGARLGRAAGFPTTRTCTPGPGVACARRSDAIGRTARTRCRRDPATERSDPVAPGPAAEAARRRRVRRELATREPLRRPPPAPARGAPGGWFRRSLQSFDRKVTTPARNCTPYE